MAKHPKVDIPLSNMKKAISGILYREGFIKGFKIIEFKGKRYIRILLKYDKDGKGVFDGITRVSKPGYRRYVGKRNIPRVLDGLGITILSTSQGLMTGKKAKNLGLGGEVICNVW
jgi:small subunit ribosomal protein S8